MLVLEQNKIGDAGVASIGDALAYVQSRHPKISVFILYIYFLYAILVRHATRFFRIDNGALFSWDFVYWAAKTRR